jgi:hypothetical protein
LVTTASPAPRLGPGTYRCSINICLIDVGVWEGQGPPQVEGEALYLPPSLSRVI